MPVIDVTIVNVLRTHFSFSFEATNSKPIITIDLQTNRKRKKDRAYRYVYIETYVRQSFQFFFYESLEYLRSIYGTYVPKLPQNDRRTDDESTDSQTSLNNNEEKACFACTRVHAKNNTSYMCACACVLACVCVYICLYRVY